ncbi:agamous-like MADS-box protein AGL29 [Senna tora]|uniref:Agamous-like MADS-box protein AGL29 n=1 Tax=Senna tora TaxID=362788 RepID=A0A835C614_9FABA|nr:agamous-like MADS-box protein AGL29 [Senna tora]
MENAGEKMRFIEDPIARNETFLKLKAELLKEASELSTLCGAEVAIFFDSPSGETYAYGYPSIETIIGRLRLVLIKARNLLLICKTMTRVPKWKMRTGK